MREPSGRNSGQMSQTSTLTAQIAAQLLASKFLAPTQNWLSAFVQTQRTTTPLPALTKTAIFRLLASDITTSLSSSASHCFPPNLQNPNIKECRLSGPIVVQVLQVEDMSKSRWEQIEAIEALERGEGTKGREIIRVAPAEETDDNDDNNNRSGGPHKLLLQDAQGARVFGVELRSVEGVGLGMSIGAKLVLRNASVARGVVLLEPTSTTMLGGKIEELHKAWKENRKNDLRAAIEASERPRT